MRGWAGSPDFLLHISEHALSAKPATIVECSSGVSTLVAARCVQLNGIGHVFSPEHDAEYAKKTRQMLAKFGLTGFASVIHAPLKIYEDGTLWYSTDLPGPEIIDMLIIDGPPQNTAKDARMPALFKLSHRITQQTHIFLDDANRPDEQAAIKAWIKHLEKLSMRDAASRKGMRTSTLSNAYGEILIT